MFGDPSFPSASEKARFEIKASTFTMILTLFWVAVQDFNESVSFTISSENFTTGALSGIDNQGYLVRGIYVWLFDWLLHPGCRRIHRRRFRGNPTTRSCSRARRLLHSMWRQH